MSALTPARWLAVALPALLFAWLFTAWQWDTRSPGSPAVMAGYVGGAVLLVASLLAARPWLWSEHRFTDAWTRTVLVGAVLFAVLLLLTGATAQSWPVIAAEAALIVVVAVGAGARAAALSRP